ncbi:MAG: excinuclease ABC subunit C [Candidatus Vogelbacteria bacterium CG22_combo_CG10-13_8_21_14_all_37_9]|uniref:Excinuclease ABC subunit C n=1 Tax=Candidatus Vogelbacteria bacterium CG22_combo_CG10-13_8_21_14_all_37_9 TaxID=1975046 RepID=A0A2H0BK93_9BACT|nr:MAG: excinuclease ABC subunit C [Candidatus Vogelbacteria bacterium CG22_combo_CG10-13_8_21_14_all_37_9]
MFYVYFLKSLKDNKLYFGSTNDLRRRLSDHNNGLVPSTKTRRPFELRYYEAFIKKADARKREFALKKDGRALAQLKSRITDSLQ